MTKAQRKERDEAIAELRGILKPGQTVYTILRHCSRSGMQRVIDLQIIDTDGVPKGIGFLAARAMGDRWDRKRWGVIAGGCGMDMGFGLVYNLSSALYRRGGFGCIGKGCPSNDHSNGDRDYTVHSCQRGDLLRSTADGSPYPHDEKHGVLCNWHRDGGYALKQSWL